MNGQQRHGTTMSAGGAVSDEVAAALRSAGVAEVDFSTRRRAEYSSDASNYRLVPAAVVFPRHRDEAAAAIEVCRELGVPLVSRGAGTSIAGNAVSSGVILDFSRHLNQVSAVVAVWLVILVSNAATTTSRWRSRRPRCCPPSALQL